MEDDDEFGDLYIDVLRAFPSSSSASHSQPPSSAPPPSLPIDVNLQSDGVDVPANSQFTSSDSKPSSVVASDHSFLPNSNPEEELGAASKIQGFDFPNETRALQTADLNLELDIITGSDDKGEDSHSKEPNLGGIEDELDGGMEEEELGSETMIPGLDTSGLSAPQDAGANGRQLDEGDGDDWDSDSEDDLQIVLNDSNHGPIGMEGNEMMVGSDDEDEDGETLVILADDDAAHKPTEEQDWGEDAAQAANGKDLTDASKLNGGLTTAPKVGYSNYGYHPFHSQFKYVRPGAAPLPGGPPVGSGGAPGQVRPPVNMGAMAGRGRGDWRPPGMQGLQMQKGFHPGFWGSNVPGRGLEFTLPSHKMIFDVDIDSFDEKPWRYPGVDVSDFFNFSLNEDSWKEYCKQLEQLRLESTMQSKIRVYESGRAEQEYDPDLPPELAAAAGVQNSSAENAEIAKVDGGLGELAKGSVRVRSPLPTGRAIQVETGYGERLPSADTRPPRLRDSDAVIEIVLQGSVDEESAGKGVTEHPDNDSAGEDDKVDAVGEDGPQDGNEYIDGYPRGYGGIKEDVTGKRSPIISSPQNDMQEEERDRFSPQRTSSYHSGSRGHTPIEKVGSPYEERWTKRKTREISPHMSSGESTKDERSFDYQQEDSIESMEGKHSHVSSSPNPIEDAREPSFEREVASDNDSQAYKKPEKIKEDIGEVVSSNNSKDKHTIPSSKHQKLSFHVEPPATKEVDDGGDFKASRSSDNSKATGSSREHHLKWREGAEEEVVQNGRSTCTSMGDLKRHRGEGGRDSRRKDRDGRMEVERSYMLTKGKEEYYSHGHRDWDPYAAGQLHLKSEGIDRKKERDYSEVSWQRRDEDAYGWRVRVDDSRKQEPPADEMVSRRRGKAGEIDRRDKDEYLHSRKLLDNGSWKGYHDKDVRLQYREKDDSLKSRHEVLDDHRIRSKRRKDEHVRRDHVEKEDYTESSSTHRKRERDDISNKRKRDDQSRARGDNMDDHHSVWVRRERAVQQQRQRDEGYRPKPPYEENLPRREREDGRIAIKSSRNVEEKMWVGHSRRKEGHDKDTGRHGEQLNRRDRVEDETSLTLQHNRGNNDGYARGSQVSNEEEGPRQERSSARNDRLAHAPDNQRVHQHDKRHKDDVRKARESEGTSKRHQGEIGLANEMAVMKGTNEEAEAKHDTPVHNHTRESKDDISSDDEQQHGSTRARGRSKLERWTSHKGRDYSINSKLSSSLKIKEICKAGSQDESAKRVEDVDKNRSMAGAKDGECPDADAKLTVDCHLDTVEKLKRRSERFKLPLTSDKDATAVKVASEALPSSKRDNAGTSQVKQERPARKRRWISS